jgi:hypothetical protein
MRIKGLVRAFNHVRLQLQDGIRPDDVEQFREQVESLVRQVEELCEQNGVTPEDLPAPSRRAYMFLKDLDTDNLPLRHTHEPANAAPGFSISGIVKTGNHFADRLWRELTQLTTSSAACNQLIADIQRHLSAIERICAEHDATPDALGRPSRQAYCWLKFLVSEDNLTSHLAALERAKMVLDRHRPRPDRPVHVHIVHTSSLWCNRQYRNVVLLKFNEGFLYAGHKAWRALIHSSMTGRDEASDRLVREYANSEDFSEVLFELGSFVASTARSTQGYAHNLDESFDRVNAAYFRGSMAKPNLVWNRTLTGRKFGHYQPGTDTVMLSVSLDDPSVPASVVDYVMYHELLHKKHGITMVNGRRVLHSPSFRADERRFGDYDEAMRHLDELALKHRVPAY